jgi:hypothetical protein
MRLARSLLVSLAAVLASSSLESQGWAFQPNGQLTYSALLASTGTFGCRPAAMATGTCTATGNSVTITNGNAAMTLSFLGMSQLFTFVAGQSQTIPLGTITKSITGTEPFTFPLSIHPNNPSGMMLTFFVALASAAPVNGSASYGGGYVSKTGTSLPLNCCAGFGSRSGFQLPVAPPPSPFSYNSLSFDFVTRPNFTIDEDPLEMTARGGVAPEPETVILLTPGLVGVMAFRRRRLRRTVCPK